MRSAAALLLFLVAQLFPGLEQSTWFDYVSIVDGNCIVQGTKVPVNQSISLVDPCESWSCSRVNATHGFVSGNGCSMTKVDGDGPCKMKAHEGGYPKCCPIMDCANSDAATG
ncbi:uncharacterized protein [Dermacentor albipictus]|uniref:uncharacterized protein n=1 Tax=Dermacentor albipictus TaxID=60249 RepID=UPI0038FBF4AC